MANYSVLKAAVQAVIKTNGNQEITGANMQSTLISIINSLGTGYQFMGVATPSTSPGTPDYNVAYIGGAGTYANFGTSVTVPVGSICVFKYNGSWTKEQIALFAGIDDVPTANSNNLVKSGGVAEKVNQIELKIDPLFGLEDKTKIGAYISAGNRYVVSSTSLSVVLKVNPTDTFVVKPQTNKSTICVIFKEMPPLVNNLDVSSYYATGSSRQVYYSETSGVIPSDGEYLVLSMLVNNADWSPSKVLINGYDCSKSVFEQLTNLENITEDVYRINAPLKNLVTDNFQIGDIFVSNDFVTTSQLSSIVTCTLYNKLLVGSLYLVGLTFKDTNGNVIIDGRTPCATEAEANDLIANGFIDLPHIKYTFNIESGSTSTSYSSNISLSNSVFDINNSPYIMGLLNNKKLNKEIRLNVPYEDGKYIDTNGVIHSTARNYKVTSQIGLCTGDILKIYGRVANTISLLCKKDGTTLTPIYVGSGNTYFIGYEYKATENCDVVVCYYGDTINISLVQNTETITPQLIKIPNYYVRYDNAMLIYTSSDTFGTSKPIRVFKDDQLTLSIQGENGLTGVLSLCDEIGEKIYPIFAANGSNYTSYNYTVKENGYVIVSGNFSSSPLPKLVILRQSVRPSFEQMLNDTEYEYGYIRERHYYSEKEDNAIPENLNTILCYDGDTKVSTNHIVNAVTYPNGTIIACRAGGSVVKIALDGTETTLLTIQGAGDWRGMFIDSNNNVYVSPHATIGGTGGLDVNNRGLYRLPYNGDTFTKVISLYNPNSNIQTETELNDDTIWTMCEDNSGKLYAGVYAHSIRPNPAIYRSTDGGSTWTYYVNFITDGIIPTTTMFGSPMHIHCIINNPYNDALYCIVGEVETVFKSIDSGTTWENLHMLVEDAKGTTMIAVPDGVLIGSDGARRGVISKFYSNDRTVRTAGIMWQAEFFGMRRSDVTGWIYAFTKIESTVGSTTFYPPIEANTSTSSLNAWKSSASAANLAAWEKYNDWVSEHYTHDAIHPTRAAILVSKDNGESWEIIYTKDTNGGRGIGMGIFCVGYFRNGECLCGIAVEENGTKKFTNPIVISEGKHIFTQNGIDLSGDIYIKTNTEYYV